MGKKLFITSRYGVGLQSTAATIQKVERGVFRNKFEFFLQRNITRELERSFFLDHNVFGSRLDSTSQTGSPKMQSHQVVHRVQFVSSLHLRELSFLPSCTPPFRKCELDLELSPIWLIGQTPQHFPNLKRAHLNSESYCSPAILKTKTLLKRMRAVKCKPHAAMQKSWNRKSKVL